MATTRILIVDPKNGTSNAFDVPDDWEANQLVPALVNSLQLPPLSGDSSNRYRLVRAQNAYVFKDNGVALRKLSPAAK